MQKVYGIVAVCAADMHMLAKYRRLLNEITEIFRGYADSVRHRRLPDVAIFEMDAYHRHKWRGAALQQPA